MMAWTKQVKGKSEQWMITYLIGGFRPIWTYSRQSRSFTTNLRFEPTPPSSDKNLWKKNRAVNYVQPKTKEIRWLRHPL